MALRGYAIRVCITSTSYIAEVDPPTSTEHACSHLTNSVSRPLEAVQTSSLDNFNDMAKIKYSTESMSQRVSSLLLEQYSSQSQVI